MEWQSDHEPTEFAAGKDLGGHEAPNSAASFKRRCTAWKLTLHWWAQDCALTRISLELTCRGLEERLQRLEKEAGSDMNAV